MERFNLAPLQHGIMLRGDRLLRPNHRRRRSANDRYEKPSGNIPRPATPDSLRGKRVRLVIDDLHVGIDVSPLALTRAGTARYLNNLLSAMACEPGVTLSRYSFGDTGRLTRIARDTAWYLGVLPHLANRGGLHVLHCPTFRAPIRTSVPLVVTFHDLAVLRHPATFNTWSRRYGRTLLPRVARAADAVIAVSKFTRQELIDLLAVPDEKIHVIPHGVGLYYSIWDRHKTPSRRNSSSTRSAAG